jgi:nicotinate-nucleotide adenylyltransferase
VTEKKLQFGLLGGAFDPPHKAHVALAQQAVEQYQLDCLYVVPTGQAWHKTRQLTAAVDRLNMTRLAFAKIPQVQVDGIEIERNGPSYTIDTLIALQQRHAPSNWFLIIGADQAEQFQTWHRWKELTQIAKLVVAARGSDAPQWHNRDMLAADKLNVPLMPISATALRQQLRLQKHSGLDWLPTSVLSYIQQHGLYAAHP